MPTFDFKSPEGRKYTLTGRRRDAGRHDGRRRRDDESPLARSAANTSPEGRAILSKSIDDRFEARANRFEDYLNSTFHYPDPIAQQEAQHAA